MEMVFKAISEKGTHDHLKGDNFKGQTPSHSLKFKIDILAKKIQLTEDHGLQ